MQWNYTYLKATGLIAVLESILLSIILNDIFLKFVMYSGFEWSFLRLLVLENYCK